MDSLHRTTWSVVMIVITVLIVGYVLLFLRTRAEALTGNLFCPMPKQVCQGSDCANHPKCASGACNNDCPGNCNKQGSV